MTQNQTPDLMTSIVLAVGWTILGLGIAAMYSLFMIFMSSGGQHTPDDYRAVPLMMTLTVTPLVTGFGWVPVVWARHKGRQFKKTAGMMIITGVGMLVLNTILLPFCIMLPLMLRS